MCGQAIGDDTSSSPGSGDLMLAMTILVIVNMAVMMKQKMLAMPKGS